MRNNHLSAYSWNNMDCNIQDKIFMTLNVMDLISSVSQVCNSIHLACCDRVLRKKLDLSKFKYNSFVRLKFEPYARSDIQSSKKLMKICKTSLNLSHRNVTCLFFHFSMYSETMRI